MRSLLFGATLALMGMTAPPTPGPTGPIGRSGAIGRSGPVGGAVPTPDPALRPPDQVFLTTDEALSEIFPRRGSVVRDRFAPTDAVREAIAAASGAAVPEGPMEVLRVRDGEGRLLGHALVVDERGKYRPITFMVGVGADFRVVGVEVMVYREDRGDEVRHGRFLRQYRGKGPGDPVRTHRDIVNITGATISVASLNRGVRRALATVRALYGGGVDPSASTPFVPGA